MRTCTPDKRRTRPMFKGLYYTTSLMDQCWLCTLGQCISTLVVYSSARKSPKELQHKCIHYGILYNYADQCGFSVEFVMKYKEQARGNHTAIHRPWGVYIFVILAQILSHVDMRAEAKMDLVHDPNIKGLFQFVQLN